MAEKEMPKIEAKKVQDVLLRQEAGYDLLPANGDLVAAENKANSLREQLEQPLLA